MINARREIKKKEQKNLERTKDVRVNRERQREREREREKIQRAMILLKRRIWDRAVMMRKMVG